MIFKTSKHVQYKPLFFVWGGGGVEGNYLWDLTSTDEF